MAQFSNTTDKNGLIQKFEFWARLPDGEVTGTLLKQVTDRINAAFENIMPILLSYSDFIRWDDYNHSDEPIGYVNIVSGTNAYKFSEDSNSLDILNLSKVRIKQSATATDYVELDMMKLDDPDVAEAMSPSSSNSGIPTRFLENAGKIYFDVDPDYNATNGIELFFQREQSYFVSTDTTKEPGIPKPFHELLALYAALDYVSVQRPTDTNTLTIISDRIRSKERDLRDFIDLRNPTDLKIIPARVKHR
jgi:hypothetical protein